MYSATVIAGAARCPKLSRRPSPTITLTILLVVAISYVLQQTLVVPALTVIQADLGTTRTWATWVFTGFLLTSAVSTPIVGRLGDIYGKKRMMVVALVAFAVGTIAAALSTSIESLIAARAVQGVGGAVFPLAFGIVRDELPPERVGVALGLLSATFGVGGGAGLVLSGVILDTASWQWLFWLGAVPVVIALVLLVLLVPESPVRTRAGIDWWGAILLGAGLAALLVALSEGERWGWLSAATLGSFALSLVLLVAWIVVELAVDEPLVDIGLMRDRSVFWTNLVGLVTGFAMFGTFLLVPTLVQMPTPDLPARIADRIDFGFGSTVTQAGLLLLPASAVMLVVGPLAGALERHVGARRILATGLFVLALGGFALVTLHSTIPGIVVAMTLIGAGVGMSYSMLAKLIVDNVDQSVTGVAMGMNTVMRTIGGVIGGQVGAAVMTSLTITGTAVPREAGYTAMFALSGLAALLAVAGALRIPRPESRTRVVMMKTTPAEGPTNDA